MLLQAATLYAKAPSSTDPSEGHNSHFAYLYTYCVLRHASLLFVVWSAKGWGPLAFTMMLQPGPQPVLPPTLADPSNASNATRERLSISSGIARAQISAVVAEAHGPWLLHLGPRERIAALEIIAGIYACLGYRRKEAYVLREVLGCVMDLVVIGREDQGGRGPSSATPQNVGLGIPSMTLNGESESRSRTVSGSLGVRENEKIEGNESILRVVRYVCAVHGVDIGAVKLIDPAVLSSNQVAEVDEEVLTEGVHPEPFGWPELQVGIVREALAIAEALPGKRCCKMSALHLLTRLRLSSRRSVLPILVERALSSVDSY
jgi:hypothetical protein